MEAFNNTHGADDGMNSHDFVEAMLGLKWNQMMQERLERLHKKDVVGEGEAKEWRAQSAANRTEAATGNARRRSSGIMKRWKVRRRTDHFMRRLSKNVNGRKVGKREDMASIVEEIKRHMVNNFGKNAVLDTDSEEDTEGSDGKFSAGDEHEEVTEIGE